MTQSHAWAAVAAILFCYTAVAQTPEQEKTWAADRERAAVADRLKAEELARQRAARRADPMAWVRTLDPMTSGGWEFRSVAPDGSSAIFSSTHQLKRSGQTVMVWMRHEYAEAQTADSGPYLSAVEKVQYDCKKQQQRTLAHRLLHRQQRSRQATDRRSRRQEHPLEPHRAGHAARKRTSHGRAIRAAAGAK